MTAASTEPPVETAKRIVGEIDTYGDPRLYALADEYLGLREVVDCLLPASGCSTVEEALAAFGASLVPRRNSASFRQTESAASMPLRCRLGWHGRSNVQIHTDDERLKFGLPYAYFTWVCPRCGFRGRTS